MDLSILVGTARSGSPLRSGQSLSLKLPESFLHEDKATLIWRDQLPSRENVILKLYRDRTRYSRLRGLLGRLRVRREFEHLSVLEGQGIPCTEPILWGTGRAEGLGLLEILATREIPGAVSLRDGIADASLDPDPGILKEVFRRVRDMHRVGIFHGALSWKNILVRPSALEAPRVFLVDLAKAIAFPRDLFGTTIARHDILYLCSHIGSHLDTESLHAYLTEYGLDERHIRRIEKRFPRFHQTRAIRRRLERAYFLLRSRVLPGTASATRRGLAPQAIP